METPLNELSADTSLHYASGHASTQPQSVFDTVPDLAVYKAGWQQRCTHYQVLRAYYAGTVYSDIPQLVQQLKLYAGIRQIFSPLRRAVNVDVALVGGGWTLPADAPAALVSAVEQVRGWSSYRRSYTKAVQHGSVAGEFGLLVVDDWQTRTVQIVPLRPDEVVLGTLADGTPFGLVVKCGLVDRQGGYEYAQLLTPFDVRVYRNGIRESQRDNAQGRVPLLLSAYSAGESGIGENSFAGTQEVLDRVNDAASQVLDVIQRNAEPLTVISGVQAVQFDADNNALHLPPADAKAYTLAPNLVIAEALEVIREVKGEFKALLPQLIFDDLRSRNDLAYDTVLTLCSELVWHVQRVRTHVDAALEQAERWALEIGMQMGALPAVPWEQHALDDSRPVLPMTPNQQLAYDAAQRALTAPQQAAPDQQQQGDGNADH